MRVRVRGGTVIGRSHLSSGRNAQDSFEVCEKYTQEGLLVAGVVSDGCGSAPRSELGAHLISAFVAEKLISSSVLGDLLPKVRSTANQLQALMRFLARQFASQEDFLFEHLLATCLGVLTNGEKCLIFYRGDGYIFIGDAALELDEGNQPNYLAYEVPGKTGGDVRLGVIEVDLRKVRRVAVATDGFEPEMIELFWGKEHPNGVQRQLNSLSRKKHFSDDATIIVMELVEEVEEDGDSSGGEAT